MNNKVIEVENLSKQYRLGLMGLGSLRHDLNRTWHLIRGKRDPYAKIGAENNREAVATSDYVWALRNVNFSVEKGEILGIIGKNGAGKSTLLKILSKITQPTEGVLKMKGRIASLLEVGTGFHPELTGRENIYLNGTILGMSRSEVKRKLEEIIEFAGVAKYIDTPVKRYSSGMIVRLGFAVAAHLEPEILIVDEVLAVGDAAFQKRAIGKMKDVTAKDGRTVLFVSHNMQSVRSLCTRSLLMYNGSIAYDGSVEETIHQYISKAFKANYRRTFEDKKTAPGNQIIRLRHAELSFSNEKPLDVTMPFECLIEFWNEQEGIELNLSLQLFSMKGECVFNVITPSRPTPKGLLKSTCRFPANLLNDGEYTIKLLFVKNTSSVVFCYDELLTFQVADGGRTGFWHGKWAGAIRPKLDFDFLPANV